MYRELIDVSDFGARDSRHSNSQPAIQAAVDTALPGDTIYFPPGVYRVSSPVVVDKPGITFSGGGGYSFRSGLQGPYGSVIQSVAEADETVSWKGNQGSMVGMHVDGNSLAQRSLHVTGHEFKLFQSAVRRGVAVTLLVAGKRCWVNQCAVVPEGSGLGVVLAEGTADAIVSDCRFVEAGERALQVSGAGNQFSNCHINGVPGGSHSELVLVDGNANLFSNVLFDTGGEVGLRIVDAHSIQVTGSRFQRGNGVNPAVVVESGTSICLIGNLLGASAGEPFSYGVEFQGSSGSLSVVSDNRASTSEGFYAGHRPDVLRGNLWVRSSDNQKFYDSFSATTDTAHGDEIPHRLFGVPRVINLTSGIGTTSRFLSAHDLNDTTFTLRLFGSSGGAIGASEPVYWYAEV